MLPTAKRIWKCPIYVCRVILFEASKSNFECVPEVSNKSYIIWDRLIKDKMRTGSSYRKPNASRQWRWVSFLCYLESTTASILLSGDVASQSKYDGKPGTTRRLSQCSSLPGCFTPNVIYYLQLQFHKVRIYPLYRKGVRETFFFFGTKTIHQVWIILSHK